MKIISKYVLLFGIFLGVMFVCLINVAYGDELELSTNSDYTLKFNYHERDAGNWLKKNVIDGIEMNVGGVDVSSHCYSFGKYQSNCGLQIMIQNERIIQQNDEIIQLLKEIRDK